MSMFRNTLLASVAVGALTAGAVSAMAGGFAIREQSASSQGASFAGNAAGGDLSSMFWNPAAAAMKNGLNTESHMSVIVPHADINVTSATHANAGLNTAFQAGNFGNNSGNIGEFAGLGASYMSYQFVNYDPNLFLAIALNSPFGLKTDTPKENYKGAVVGRESRLLTMNINPTLAYRLSPSLMVGAGVQLQYGKGMFSFATGLPNGADSKFEGSGMTAGATAGVMWMPSSATTIGLGWRSAMTQHLDGAYINTPATNPFGTGSFLVNAKSKIELPDIVTLSLRQSITSNTRLLGTVEWSNWGVFNELRVVADGNSNVIVPNAVNGGGIAAVRPGSVIATLPADWNNGFMFSLGGEYDVSKQLTVRAGGAYEISPIDTPDKRLIGIPDNDRIWASLGATYKWSESMSFDVAYTHLFVKDSTFNRQSLSGFNVAGTIDASTDIVSLSMKTKW